MKKGTAMVLKESSYASIENFDHACRNNTGYLMTLVGVFRWMDLTGVPAYHTLMKDLLPTLNNNPAVPQLIDNIVREDGRGVANAKGFCNYTPKEAKLWEETFTEFSYEIRKLALKYPYDVVERCCHRAAFHSADDRARLAPFSPTATTQSASA